MDLNLENCLSYSLYHVKIKHFFPDVNLLVELLIGGNKHERALEVNQHHHFFETITICRFPVWNICTKNEENEYVLLQKYYVMNRFVP